MFTNFGNRKVLCLRGLYHDFLSISFVSQCRKYWQMNPSVLCFRKLPVAKKFMDKRGGEYQDFPSKIFCLTVPKNFVGEFFTVALISGTEKNWRREGVSRFYVEKFLSHSTEKFRRGFFYCCVNFEYRKKLEKRGGGVIKILRRKILTHSAENFRRESFTVALLSGTENVWRRCGGGGVSRFYGEKLLPDSAENIRMGILYCCINFGYRKSLERRGVSRLYVEFFLPHSAEKLRRGIFYCCVNFEYRKKLEKRGGVSSFYVETFLTHSAETFRRGIFYCCIIFR